MKRRIPFILCVALLLGTAACSPHPYAWLRNAMDTATYQLEMMDGMIADTCLLPRGVCRDFDEAFVAAQLGLPVDSLPAKLKKHPSPGKVGRISLTKPTGWTSGFYPGSLWIAGDITGNRDLWKRAAHYTNLLEPLRSYKKTHDLGFMVWCSFGNALALSPADSIRAIVTETAGNLAGRFNATIGSIRSWDSRNWNYPVIIDNMMNLEILFEVSRLTGDPQYRDVAVRHANTTLRNHFRPDGTSYHVVSYNDDGTIESKGTHQGRSDGSAWSRGQAWGLYGFTVCFRETGDTAYLDKAVEIADMIMERVRTKDAVPYWDYDAPEGEDTPRDASAAAITASAMLELSGFAPDGSKYAGYAEKILHSLASPAYLAKKGTNEGFILRHCVTSLPGGSEIDSPLVYADYYFLEAIRRYMGYKGLTYESL